MITPRIKPSSFWRHQPDADLFVQDQRQAKLGGFIANLAAMDELIDFAAIAARVDTACPRADRSCRIPDDCIDSKRYPLFMARAVLKELIESLQSTQGVKPC